MTIRIDGTNTAANPGITGADTDTGLQFGTDEIQLVTGGTNRATVESNGNFTIEDGNLVVAAGHGIDFSADANGAGMTSELLDDYEEGTWTPTTKQGTVSNSSVGAYIKVGNLCTVTAYVVGFSNITSSDNVEVQGLPFAAAASDAAIGAVMIRYVNNTNGSTALTAPVGYLATTDASLRVYQQSAQGDANYDALKYEDLNSTVSTSIRWTLTYITA